MDPFKELYDKYKEDIYKYLYYLSGDPYIAEDLMQETFIGAYKSIHKFRGDSKVSTWLFQIAKYTFYDFLRKKDKEERVIDNYFPKSDESEKNSPEDIYRQKEDTKFLINAIKRLK